MLEKDTTSRVVPSIAAIVLPKAVSSVSLAKLLFRAHGFATIKQDKRTVHTSINNCVVIPHLVTDAEVRYKVARVRIERGLMSHFGVVARNITLQFELVDPRKKDSFRCRDPRIGKSLAAFYAKYALRSPAEEMGAELEDFYKHVFGDTKCKPCNIRVMVHKAETQGSLVSFHTRILQ